MNGKGAQKEIERMYLSPFSKKCLNDSPFKSVIDKGVPFWKAQRLVLYSGSTDLINRAEMARLWGYYGSQFNKWEHMGAKLNVIRRED